MKKIVISQCQVQCPLEDYDEYRRETKPKIKKGIKDYLKKTF